MNRNTNQSTSFENAGAAREIELENKLITPEHQLQQQEQTDMFKHLPLKTILASNYLSAAEQYISQLVSTENYQEILTIAHRFPGNLTNFVGFECRLNGDKIHTDWALAISGKDDARYVLTNFLNNGGFPKAYWQIPEWKHIRDFATTWANPHSLLYEKILGAWFEYDMPDPLPSVSVPSLFFNPAKINGSTVADRKNYEWLVKTAIPLLVGQRLSRAVERNLYSSIENIPTDASLFIVGVMLPRNPCVIRMSVRFRNPKEIIPYLGTIGWMDTTDTFPSMIEELAENHVNRMVLDYDVSNRIGRKIGLECSFSPNLYHQETHWKDLLDYLLKKGLVTPEKHDALLQYAGTENTKDFSGAVMTDSSTQPSGDLQNILNGRLVRYISHIKIVYRPRHPFEVKAYPAVRLFKQS